MLYKMPTNGMETLDILNNETFCRDVILDFEWRKSGDGALDYQMVTWSKDQSLRLWAPDQETQYRCKRVQ